MASYALGQNEDASATIARGVADHLLRETGAERGLLRCRQHTLQAIDNIDELLAVFGLAHQDRADTLEQSRFRVGLHALKQPRTGQHTPGA